MHVQLLYFEDCPNWMSTHARLLALGDELGFGVQLVLVDSDEAAQRWRFRGSPTVLLDGRDLFDDPTGVIGLACRVYRTSTGLSGSPSLEQLRAAFAAR